MADKFEKLENFDLENTEKTVRDICEELDIKPGLIINAVRTAATGQSAGPGLFEIIVILGKEKTIERIRKAVGLI